MSSVLITGAGRGLGRELFGVYVERGWTVLPLVRNSDVASQLQALAGPACLPIVCDVADDSTEERVSEVLQKHGEPLDVLVNNAGHIRKLRWLKEQTPDDLEEMFRVHVVGVFRCTRASLPFLSEADKPVVVNISSRRGSLSRSAGGFTSGVFSYQIAKSAQNMLTVCLDHELRPSGVRVFAVHPGGLKTDVAPPDADTDPRDAALALADWIDRIDDETVCGFHDLMGGELIPW